MDEAAKQMRTLFERMLEGFKAEVNERRRRGETETEMYELLADDEKIMIGKRLDEGLRILVIEKMRAIVREVYRPS